MKLKNSLLRSVSIVSLIACASTQPVPKLVETVEVDVPLEVGLSFVPKLVVLRIDFQDSDGQLGLTSATEIYQIIPTYGNTSGNNMPDPLSPEQAYGIFLRSKK